MQRKKRPGYFPASFSFISDLRSVSIKSHRNVIRVAPMGHHGSACATQNPERGPRICCRWSRAPGCQVGASIAVVIALNLDVTECGERSPLPSKVAVARDAGWVNIPNDP